MSAGARPIRKRLPAIAGPGLRGVIFDLDGILVDTERVDRQAWYAVAARHGFPMSDELHALTIGRREADLAGIFGARLGPGLDWHCIGEAVRHWREEYVHEHGMPRKPGVLEILEQLDRMRLPYAVATSTERVLALGRLADLAGRMSAVACGDEVARGKPAPDIYLLAAQRLGVDPRHCLALEDSVPGVAAAEEAGATVVMVPDLVAPPDDVKYVCASLLEVRDWLSSVAVP